MDQAFETKMGTWKWESDHYPAFAAFCEQVFKDGEEVKISRSDVFAIAKESDFVSTLFAVILWGYPRNMRGNSFSTILDKLPAIKAAFPLNKNLSESHFKALCQALSGSGMGLSTLTKLLYFMGYKLEGHRCLILDQRIIDVINDKSFYELSAFSTISYFNKNAQYIQYLQKMEELSVAEGYKVDQLELFLFQFGKNLKKSLNPGEKSRVFRLA